MNTVNETGLQAGRYLYRTHEVRGITLQVEGGSSGAGSGIHFGKHPHTLFGNVQHSGTGNDKTLAITRKPLNPRQCASRDPPPDSRAGPPAGFFWRMRRAMRHPDAEA